MSMTFHAIDVETANSNRDSICQIGIVYVRNGAIRDQWDTLVNPEGWFDPYNIGIHGITSDDVRSSPTWDEFHEDLSGRLSGSIMVSHSPFDKVAVKRTTEKYGLLDINVKWLDSAMIVRRAWPEHFGQKGWGLPNVARFLGIGFRHHDALEDARVAAEIVLHACKHTAIDVDEWLVRLGQRQRPRSKAASITREGNRDGALQGERVLFTGALSIPRREAANLAAEAGCRIVNNMSKKVTILVLGDQDISRLAAGKTKSSKHRIAESLIRQGAEIQIVSENDFQRLVCARW